MQVHYQIKGNNSWDLLDPQHYYVLDGTGKILIKQSGYDILPPNFCLSIDGQFIDRTNPTSAEMVKSLVAGVSACDRFITSPDSGFGAEFGLFGGWDRGGPIETDLGRPTGEPSQYGMYNQYLNDCPYGGNFYQYLKTEQSFNPSQKLNYLNSGNFGYNLSGSSQTFSIGCYTSPMALVLGRPNDAFGVSAHIGVRLQPINLGYDDECSGFPDGTIIESAQWEITGPSGLSVYDWEYYIGVYNPVFDSAGEIFRTFIWPDHYEWGDPAMTYSPPWLDSSSNEIVNPGWIIAGRKTNGDFIALGNVTGTGSIKENQTKVVDATELVRFLDSYRNSIYTGFYVFPGSIAGSTINLGDYDEAHPNSSLLVGIRDGFHKYTLFQEDEGDPRLNGHTWYYKVKVRRITMEYPIGFGSLSIRFKLPSGVIKTQRLNYGNMVDLSPR